MEKIIKYLKIVTTEHRTQVWGPSERRILCDCIGHKSMKLTLLTLFAAQR